MSVSISSMDGVVSLILTRKVSSIILKHQLYPACPSVSLHHNSAQVIMSCVTGAAELTQSCGGTIN